MSINDLIKKEVMSINDLVSITLMTIIKNDHSLIGDIEGCRLNHKLLNYTNEIVDTYETLLFHKDAPHIYEREIMMICSLAYVTWCSMNKTESPCEHRDNIQALIA